MSLAPLDSESISMTKYSNRDASNDFLFLAACSCHPLSRTLNKLFVAMSFEPFRSTLVKQIEQAFCLHHSI